jgi:hypothetical protein
MKLFIDFEKSSVILKNLRFIFAGHQKFFGDFEKSSMKNELSSMGFESSSDPKSSSFQKKSSVAQMRPYDGRVTRSWENRRFENSPRFLV